MTAALALMGWEVRHALRQLLPWRWVRWLGGVFFVAAVAAALAYMGRAGLNPKRPIPPDFFLGFVGLNLGLATAAAGLGLAQLVGQPRRLWSSWSSPISPQAALTVALSPAVLAALCPLTLFLLPFALAAARRDPKAAAGLLVAGACALGWAVAIAVGAGALTARRLGPVHGSRTLALFSGALAFVTLAGFRSLVSLKLGRAALVGFLIVTPLLLPAALARASRALSIAVRGSAASGRSPEPVWGKAGWIRQLRRSVSPLGLIALLPVLWAWWVFPAQRLALTGILALQLVALPLERLMEPELACPDRLRLAPLGAAYRRKLLGLWGGGALVAAWGGAALVAWPRARWLAALAGLGGLLPFTYFVRERVLRIGMQVLLWAGVLWASVRWSH